MGSVLALLVVAVCFAIGLKLGLAIFYPLNLAWRLLLLFTAGAQFCMIWLAFGPIEWWALGFVASAVPGFTTAIVIAGIRSKRELHRKLRKA